MQNSKLAEIIDEGKSIMKKEFSIIITENLINIATY